MHAITITPPEQWGTLLREHGLRVTEGRLDALGYLEVNPHSSAAAIHAALSEESPSLSPQSVHNIVNDLTEAGMLRRIDPPEAGRALYETRTGDNHHHVQCIDCHRIEDVDCVVGGAPCLSPSHSHGMRLLEASITFRGICAECERVRESAGHASVAAASSPALST